MKIDLLSMLLDKLPANDLWPRSGPSLALFRLEYYHPGQTAFQKPRFSEMSKKFQKGTYLEKASELLNLKVRSVYHWFPC